MVYMPPYCTTLVPWWVGSLPTVLLWYHGGYTSLPTVYTLYHPGYTYHATPLSCTPTSCTRLASVRNDEALGSNPGIIRHNEAKRGSRPPKV